MIISILRITLGLFFIFTGAVKLIDLTSFRDSIHLFNILPDHYLNLAAILIPSIELICGLALTLNIFKKATVSILISLMTVFIVAIAINLNRGESFECGCFGVFQLFGIISWSSILLNAGIVGLLVTQLFLSKSSMKITEQLKVVSLGVLISALIANIPLSNSNLKYSLIAQNIRNVNWDKALHMIEADGAALFDGRSAQKYDHQHVPEAQSLPLHDFDKYFQNYDNISKSTPIMVYCDNEVCGTSKMVAHKLVLEGFKEIYIIKTGFEGWLKTSWATHTEPTESIGHHHK